MLRYKVRPVVSRQLSFKARSLSSKTRVTTPFAAATVTATAATALYASSSTVQADSGYEEGKFGQVEFGRSHFSTKSTKTLTQSDVDSRLRAGEEAYVVDRGNGVGRFDIVQFGSNAQIEDDFTAKIVNVKFSDGQSDWCFFGVFDGHGGWNTSAKLRELLVPYVAAELMETIKPDASSKEFGIASVTNGRLLDHAIEHAFLKLDNDIVRKPVHYLVENPYKAASAELLMPALSGSCALLSFYDPATRIVKVACTGDSRAVLGHKDPSGTWTATPLSYDQCGRNVNEVKRLQEEHPKEKDTVIQNGRVLGGLEPTRAFGDARYKLPPPLIDNAASLFFGRRAPAQSRTPPYVTARPDVVSAKVEPGDFLVLATDGVWDVLSPREVTQLVVEWVRKAELETGKPPEGVATKVRTGGLFGPVSDLADVKVVSDTAELNARLEDKPDASKTLRNALGMQKHFRGLFTIEDQNVATHIVRNALGGADKDQTAMLVSLPAPISRRYRDDMTAVVVFFNDSTDGSGKIHQVREATRGGN
ncbi:phosphatase 2C-like domain-containing protein [Lipomyces arxii]|uniref:phosphatase 2C-like domain-containing protein n=1 Tax=Lipomyces arxii TaxID=56418 RepID=UPI0034CE6A62